MIPSRKQLRSGLCSLFVLMFLSPRAFLLGQSQQIYFEEVLTPDGNPLGKINAITQDKLGFMWFSDESNEMLVRYDGSHMEYYEHDPENSNSPGGTFPHALDAGPSGEIWIGYIGAGLDRFDPYTNTFTHYRHDPEDPQSLADSTNRVAAVLVDRDGMVWTGTGQGLSRLDPSTGKFTHYQHDPDDPNSLSSNVVRTLYEDRSGTLWVGTGFPYFVPEDGGLNRFHAETGTFTRYKHNPQDPASLTGNKITAILEDSSGTFWIGTDGEGLQTMDRKTGKFTRLLQEPDNPSKLRETLPGELLSFVKVLLEDNKGNIWIGSNDNGTKRFNPETGKVTYFGKSADGVKDVIENTGFDSFLETNSAWSAHTADEGLIWLSSEQNPRLFKVDLNHNAFHKINEADVQVVFEETPEILWKGTNQGLIQENLNTGTKRLFQNRPGDSTSLSFNVVRSITRDRNGHLWIGTVSGLNLFDPDSGKFRRFMQYQDPSLFSFTNDVLEDRHGNIWVARENGAYRKGPTDRTFKRLPDNPQDSTQVFDFWVNNIVEDSLGFVWLGGKSIIRYNTESDTFKEYQTPIEIANLTIDFRGQLWAGNRDGFFLYDPDKDQFIESLADIRIRRVISDSQNKLWTHNPDGLVRYDPETGQTTLFGLKFGVRGSNSLFPTTPYRKADGTLLFSNAEEYYEFNPELFWRSRDSSRLYATQLELTGSAGNPGTRISLLSQNSKEAPVTLSASQNAFSIWLSAIDFRNTGRNVIQYMLEGYDTEWLQGNAEFPANYAQVPPGDYTFRLRAVNSSSGIPSENSIKLKVLPPWWATWWAYAAYGLLFIFGLWIVDRYRKNRVLRVAREKAQSRELEQAKEIEKAYSELKATQTQLIHSEKMASLGELTAGIAHEIQNPLNFVKNFSEVSRELIDEMKEEIKKQDFGEVDAIADDLKQNLEKITHHGQRADGIVKGMLQHSRSSDGKKEPADLNKLVDEYFRLAYHGMRARDKSFNVQMDSDLDDRIGKVTLIPQDIGRVLLNLLTNAFHAVKEKSEQSPAEYEPIVKVRTKKTGKGVQIEVEDNGNGIPERIRNKIFQPFFTTKPTGQGTGLGLSLSYDIVKAHGGDIEVRSKEGEGTTFKIVLLV